MLLISVDGLHQSDLSWYVQNHPSSELAKLAFGGRVHPRGDADSVGLVPGDGGVGQASAYEILNGPSGKGIQDLFTPEINSSAIGYPAGNDWTTDNAATMQYDSYKVQAVINEIDGFGHSGTQKVGVPAIFGMNFQTVSTGEKLPTSDGLTGRGRGGRSGGGSGRRVGAIRVGAWGDDQGPRRAPT